MEDEMPSVDLLSVVYTLYAAVSVGLTIWLARTLAKNGRVFLEDVFTENSLLADAVNKLLVVGFYLVNFGYACLLLRGGHAPDLRGAIETLAAKLGWLLMSLAVMHFVNMFIFHRIRRRARRSAELPPIHPHGFVAPPALAPSTLAATPTPV
jgi:hypothetical protein